MTRPILYISGPYSAGYGHSTEDNIETARAYAVRAWEMGWAAFTPHLNTAGFEHLCTGVEHDDWLDGDLAFLSLLNPARDAVLMLPRWILSRGAKIEHEAALSRKLRVYYADAIEGGVPEVPKRAPSLTAPEWCLGCPHPIYDDRKGKWDWYCRQHSPTGIKCTNVAVLWERCYRVREYFARKEASK